MKFSDNDFDDSKKIAKFKAFFDRLTGVTNRANAFTDQDVKD